MAYTSIEALIWQWVDERNIECGRNDVMHLAEQFTEILMPYRELFRALDRDNAAELVRAARAMERSL